MKRISILLFSILILSSVIRLSAQDKTYTMLKEGTTWCYVYRNLVQYIFQYSCYKVDGDTLINGKAYKKIYSYKGEYNRSNAFYKGALREDNQKVYCEGVIPSSDFELEIVDGESILYDFSLYYDDTFATDKDTGEPCIVEAVEYREYLDGIRKYINLDGPLIGTWVEGIGSLIRGLFIPCGMYYPGMHFISLSEFIQDGKMIYHTPNLNFAKDSIRWLERKSSEESSEYKLINYHVNGDTIINNLSYKKVYANELYHGAIRMNIEHKVYFIKESFNKEIVLYDFDWLLCKALHSTNYTEKDFVLVDTEHMGGIYQDMKTTLLDGKEYDYRILTSNPNPEGIPFHTLNKEVRLIKDIGLTSGIFSHVEVSKEDARSYNDLVSVYDGDKLIYLNPAFKENGELETSIRPVVTELRLQVTVSNGEAVFTLQEGSKTANTLLRIYSVDGRLVTTRSLDSGKATVGNLPTGVYYYRTESGQGMPANGKFMME